MQPMIIRQRGEREVDRVIGKKHRSPLNAVMDFSECPLAKRYPNWDLFLDALYEERKAAKLEKRDPHPATLPPYVSPYEEREIPVCKGLSPSAIKLQYGSKDPS
jgi:hypothetical protein